MIEDMLRIRGLTDGALELYLQETIQYCSELEVSMSPTNGIAAVLLQAKDQMKEALRDYRDSHKECEREIQVIGTCISDALKWPERQRDEYIPRLTKTKQTSEKMLKQLEARLRQVEQNLTITGCLHGVIHDAVSTHLLKTVKEEVESVKAGITELEKMEIEAKKRRERILAVAGLS